MYNQTAYDLGSQGSVIRDLAEYGQQRATLVGSQNVFDFSIGNPNIPAPSQVYEVIQQVLANTDPLQIHSYTPAAGLLQTRQAIADDLNCRYGTAIGADELFLGCGSSQELVSVFRALTVPNARFLAIAPYFPEYKPFVEAAGAALDVVPPDVPDFQINLDAVASMLTPNTVALIVNSPNNPAGTVYTADTLRALADLLTEASRQYGHPIYIVSDEPYRELVYDGTQVPYLPAIYPNTVVCYSYSKSLSLPGERIGYVLIPRQAENASQLYAAVAGAARSFGHVCAPSLWQQVIARCAHLRPDLASYDKNRRVLYEGLTAAGYRVAKPDGAFYLFVEAPGGDANAFSEKAKALDLLIVPGDSFGCPGWFRLCYCVSHDKILRSLPLFRQLI